MENISLFLQNLNDTSISSDQINNHAKTILADYHNNKEKLSNDIQRIGLLVSDWIKNNFSSKSLPFAFRLLINLYEEIGFSLYFDVQDYYKTSDKLDEKDPKALGKSDLEGFENDKDVLIENPLLSSHVIQVVLSLIENLVTKRMHVTHKNILVLALPLISIYSTDKKVQSIIRKKKFIKMILKIFKDVVESVQNLTEIDVQICSYLLHTIAKLTFHNKKNQDYLIKKKGHEYIKGVIATSQDLLLLQGAISSFSNLSETNDGSLVLWCSGCVPFLIQRTKVSLANIRKYLDVSKRKTATFKHALRDLELCLVAIWKLSAGTDEVIEECFGNKDFPKNLEEIFEMMEVITSNDPHYLNYVKCLGVSIAIIRRFCMSEKFRKPTTDRYLKYILKVPQVYCEQIKNVQETHSFLLKEVAGLIGAVSVDQNIIQQSLENSRIFEEILNIGLAYFDNAKLIKTILGLFTNATAIDNIRDNLAREKNIYILLYNVLEKYDYSNLIIDYALKLILNTSQNEMFYRNYVSSRFLERFIFIFHIYLEDDQIHSDMIKIFRLLNTKVKSTEVFVGSINEYEKKMQNQFEFISALVENARIDDYRFMIDTILLISTLSENSQILKEKISGNQKIIAFINTFINCYKGKPQIFKLVSSSLACLPLEEFGSFL